MLGGEVEEDCWVEIAAKAGPLDEWTGMCMGAVGIWQANICVKGV